MTFQDWVDNRIIELRQEEEQAENDIDKLGLLAKSVAYYEVAEEIMKRTVTEGGERMGK